MLVERTVVELGLRGELRQVKSEEATTDYLYDYTGQRTVKTVTAGSKTSRTVYLDKYAELRDGALVKYIYLGEALASSPARPMGCSVSG